MTKYQRIDEEIAKERERIKQMFGSEEDKIGLDPTQPYHPIFNPSLEEEQQRAKSEEKWYRREKKRQLSKSQEIYYNAAVKLIREGKVRSYAELGAAFHEYDKRRGTGTYSAGWAYKLVNKLVVRGVFTKAEIQKLIPDASPFKSTKQRQSNN